MRQQKFLSLVLIFVGGLLAADWAGAESVTVAAGSAKGAVGSTVKIPILIQGAQDLGALQMDLVFDPAVLEVESVEPGALLSGLVDSNAVAPGRLRIAMATSQAVNGDGELLTISFKVLGGGQTPLTPEMVEAWQAATSFSMMATTQAGSFTSDGGVFLMVALAALAVGILAILGLAFFMVRRKRSQSEHTTT